jgi:hypothetical protein
MLLSINTGAFSQNIFTGGKANWNFKITGKNYTPRSTDSARFIFNPGLQIGTLYLYSHKNANPIKTRIKAIIENFTGIGSYSITSATVEESGTACSFKGNNSGTLTVTKLDTTIMSIEGSFEMTTTCHDDINNNDYLAVVREGKFKIGNYRTFTLLDGRNLVMANIPSAISLVTNINPKDNIKKFDDTTDADGQILVEFNKLSENDQLIFEIFADTIRATKQGHEAVDNIKYIVKLDNMDIDKDGNVNFLALTNARKDDTLKMVHTTLMYNLVISIEWNAKTEYFNQLSSWLTLGCNYLYDVTNGQCMLNKIAIYDNAVNSQNADMMIYANNIQWPLAHINGIDMSNPTFNITQNNDKIVFPRAWGGSLLESVLTTAKPFWMTVNRSKNLRPIIHEFGHYGFGFYDEYKDVFGNPLNKTTNFGYMDNAYLNLGFPNQLNDDFTSEMSDAQRYMSDPIYVQTQQYALNVNDCWNHFKNKYEKDYGSGSYQIFCQIKLPSDQLQQSGNDFLPGPNEDIDNPNWDISNQMEIISFNTSDLNFGDFSLQIPEDNEINVEIATNPRIILVKNGNAIIQGLAQIDIPPVVTGYDRKAIVLGAEVNDQVYYEYTVALADNTIKNISGIINIDQISKTEKSELPEILTNKENSLQLSVDSTFNFINFWNYNSAGDIELKHYSDANYLNSPFIMGQKYDNSFEKFTLNYNSNEKYWSVLITDTLSPLGINFFNFYYKPDSTFFSFQYSAISNFSNEVFANSGSASIHFDSKSDLIERVAIFSTQYSPIKNGIKSFAKNPAEIHSISVFPPLNIFDENDSNYFSIHYNPKSLTVYEEATLKMFRFDETVNKWELIGGIVDTNHKYVSAKIPSPGVYTIFSTELGTSININVNDGYQMYLSPNPATDFLEFSYPPLERGSGGVDIKIYNMYGQIQTTPSLRDTPPWKGGEKVRLNVSGLAPGMYFFRMGDRVSKFIKL